IKEHSLFIGYQELEVEGKLLYILQDDKLLREAKEGMEVQLIFNKTPFYAESGGQVADTGVIVNDDAKLVVNEVTKAPNGQHLHLCKVISGKIEVGSNYYLKVNKYPRDLTTRNHTATHLLHKALKMVLGDHIAQAGSYVGSDRLRFDFNHFEAISKKDLEKIEKIVNEQIVANLQVKCEEMPIAKAKEKGAIALFSEKYGDIVRVVSTGEFSKELCGGCHVNRTSEIGLFKIISESGIGAGIRRIEAVTSEKAIEYTQTFIHSVETISLLLKANPQDITTKVKALLEENKQLAKELASLNQKIANEKANSLLEQASIINGYTVLSAIVHNIEINALRNMVDNFKSQLKSAVVVLANITQDKVVFMCGITNDYVDKGLNAGQLVKEMAKICGGNGGGRADFAQAGANNTQNVDKAIKFASEFIKSK
ncbi:MAG TPA: DHHA1 domain-containing protein, partial [Haloplasmataceae bacterium]